MSSRTGVSPVKENFQVKLNIALTGRSRISPVDSLLVVPFAFML